MTDNSHRIIEQAKSDYGSNLVILAHHYQQDEVVRHADVIGDSLELSRKIADLEAEHIVFCGVSFMAETAAILARPGQKVYLPAPEAGCPMSEMAQGGLLAQVLARLNATGRRIIPLAYVNTQAAVKAVCGRFGGSVCTSANAGTMLDWALKQGDGVLFAPDRNLAHNTADLLGIPESERVTLGISVENFEKSLSESGEPDAEKTADAKLIVWPGYCSVHECFDTGHLEHARKESPDAKVIVHPECRPDVVRASDASGSTSSIIRYCRDAAEGSTIYIGTEIHLVKRLADQYNGVKTIRPLMESSCADMAATDAALLASVLSNLDAAEPETVPEETAAPARTALERMLAACA
mgnify:CR=1 FL=1